MKNKTHLFKIAAEEDEPLESERRTAIGEIDEIVGFHIRLAYGAVYRHFMETFSDLELTQKQVSVLWLISDNPGVAQSDLARILQIDRATMMAIINRLQDRGFLKRQKSTHDARKQILSLKPAGVAILDRAKCAIHEHENWLKSRFTASETRTLIDLLRRVHG